jgi:hypothetical protein
MRKLFPFCLMVVCLIGMAGCRKNFAEINTNPNNPETVNPELLMVTIIRGLVNEMNNDAFSPGNIVAQYSAEIRDPSTDRYEWTDDFGVWDNGYSILTNVQDLYDIATASNLNNYRGIALVLKSLIFARMTDCFGALPYSQALQARSDAPNYTPAYDSQQTVYQGMLNDLKTADTLFSANGGYIRNDILYNNDWTKWQKFANTLRMRLLLRESNKVDPSADMQEIVNNPTLYPLFASNADNAALIYSAAPNISPITNQRSAFFLDRRLSRTLASVMNATEDPRLPVYAQPSTNSVAAGNPQYVGVLNGSTDDSLSSNIDDSVSALGLIYYNGLDVAVPSQGLVMTYSELQFILAEAAQRGWITGDAKQYYEAGIGASVAYYASVSGLPLTVTSQFLAQPGVAYVPARGLQLIGTQRWIALFFNDLQGWQEWKRTGYPALTPSLVNYNDNKIPVRLLYPQDQQVTNLTNYNAAIAIQGPDNINTKVWWMN